MNVKPEYTSSICQIKSGHDIPATLLAKLLAENKNAIGMVVKEGDKLFVEKETRLASPEAAAAWFGNIQGNTNKFSKMFTFHAVQSGEYDEDEIQPYTILKDSKEKPILCVCVEGDFPKFANDPEGFSESLVLCRDWLGPKIEAMYKILGNNPQKTVEYLKTVQFSNDFEQVVGHRGFLAFMPVHGDQFTVQKNELGMQSDWGEVSNAYGYTESAVASATPAPVEVPKATKANRYADPVAPTPTAPVPPPPPVPQVPAAPVADPIQRVAAAAVKDAEVIEEQDWTPPANLHGKELKDKYRAMNWHLPEAEALPKNWKQRPTIRIKVKTTVKSLGDLAQTKAGIAATAAAANVETVPILSGPQMATANEMLKKILGDGSQAIADPINANEIETKIAKFSELMLKSKNIEEIRRVPHAAIFAFAKENPEATALLVIELRAVARKFWDLERATAPAQVTIPGAAPAPAVPAATPAVPAAAPEKKGALKYA